MEVNKYVKKFIISLVITLVGIILIHTQEVQAIDRNEYIKKIENINKKYKGNNIQFLNGIVIDINDKFDLTEYIKEYIDEEIIEKELQQNNVVSLENKYIIAKNEGTEFIILKGNKNVYALEILVSGENNLKKERSTIVNRDYYKVFIDPGHGGEDPGAVANGVKETDLNLKIAKKLKSKLEKKNINVQMTREKEETISLYERANMANKYDGDIFVSIHQNSFTSGNAYGIETYYHRDKSQHKSYADIIQKSLIKNTNSFDRGIKTANFVVLRETVMPSALIECGFITNLNEVNKLKSDAYQEKIAEGVSNAISEYLVKNITLTQEKGVFKDTKGHWGEAVIKKFVNKGYVEGYKDGTFKPNSNITRAEFIKIINRVFNFTSEAEEGFSDVNKNDWFYSEVRKSVKAGYISIANKQFRPNDNITREEAAAIITNIKKNKDENLDKISKYEDFKKVSKWALPSVEGAIEAGYMGKGSKTFRPQDKLTRAEAVALLDPLVK